MEGSRDGPQHLRRFDAVAALLDDSAQRRNGTDFEARCLATIDELRPMVADVQRPYLAARHIAAEDFHQPLDRFGLIAPMTELAERYEDHPDDRATIAAEIGAELAAFRTRAPWPITDGG